MFKHTLNRILKIQFVRQLIGGGIGALVGLWVYTMFGVTSDAVQAFLAHTEAPKPVPTSTLHQNPDAFKNIGELARERLRR